MILPYVQIDERWYMVVHWRENLPPTEILTLRPLTEEETEDLDRALLDVQFEVWATQIQRFTSAKK